MKIFVLIAIMVAIFGYVQAGDKCTLDGKTFNKGETYQPPGKCELYECFGSNGMIAKGCASVDTLKPCRYIPQDNTKAYPKCCPRHECK